MEISVSTTSMGFREQTIPQKKSLTSNEIKFDSEQTASYSQKNVIYGSENRIPVQQYVLLASTQITLNNSLRETLKYLKMREAQKRKEPIIGDLWQISNVENEESEKNPYKNDLLDFSIDANKKNIFAA